MRVLTLTTIYPNEQFAAEGRSVAFLDQALAAQGIAGTTLVLKQWAPNAVARRVGKWRHLAVAHRVETEPNLRVIYTHYLHVPRRLGWEWCVRGMTYQAMRKVRQYGIEFDIVHGQSIYPTALAAQEVATRFGVPYVVTLRDDLSHLSDFYEKAPEAEPRFRSMFGTASAVFVHGPALVRDAPRFMPSEDAVSVVLAPNGVDVQGIQDAIAGFTPTPHAWGEIVSVSNLYRYKGIHENLEALALLDRRGIRSWRYTVVGDGPFRAELEARAKELGLTERVQFRGRFSHVEALRAMAGADIFCLPSWAEPFGNVYAEAAVCGRAAIGCRGFGAELMIREGETGLLVTPREAGAVADALEILLTNPERGRAMGVCAQEHVRQFTWERTATLYADELNRISTAQAHR